MLLISYLACPPGCEGRPLGGGGGGLPLRCVGAGPPQPAAGAAGQPGPHGEGGGGGGRALRGPPP